VIWGPSLDFGAPIIQYIVFLNSHQKSKYFIALTNNQATICIMAVKLPLQDHTDKQDDQKRYHAKNKIFIYITLNSNISKKFQLSEEYRWKAGKLL